MGLGLCCGVSCTACSLSNPKSVVRFIALHTVLPCRFIAPIEGVGLLVWWIVEEILTNKSTWWQFQTESLAVVLTEWAVVILVLIGLNWWMGPLTIPEPRSRGARRVLGFFFKLTPRQQPSHEEDLEQSRDPSVPVC